ncbi:uncharacterized protein LOC121196839 [Toxotes jaculatrix]|uniref:uncharacterized protein LOC121196839 n=1 Tax=Toxotes jaculatrix TaxID=941984 RepID=UPI001B3A82E3|nr:uncharacterized protein LOC121196839 [Toxotes jaculatrix]
MMLVICLFCFFYLPWIKGASHSKQVVQTPLSIIKRIRESVDSEIGCSHSITNYDLILWYKQEGQRALKLLGYLNMKFVNLEDSAKGKISFDGDGEKQSKLSIFNLSLSDSGLIDGSDITQTPVLWVDKGNHATMDCNHTKGSTFRLMYWFQQLPGETMKQIVLTTAYSDPEYEGGFSKDKFPTKKSDTETGSLTVEKVEPGDSGVYFCAVSVHSDVGDSDSCTNTQLRVCNSEQKTTILLVEETIYKWLKLS